MKLGLFNSTQPGGPTQFGPEIFSGPNINTWVLWANEGAQPTELALAVNNPPLSSNYVTGKNNALFGFE